MVIIYTISLVVVLLFSCERDDDIKIPFGYDPEFNYLTVLKSSPGYAYEKSDGYPELTYQDPADEHLVEIKNIYKLDSVAGKGNEVDNILNLFNWVHNGIRHDGGNSSPDPENSLNILNYCSETGEGVNCVYMSIVLNEVYLSMGIKSRVIHGNCKKFIFNGDWHAFNIVYSNLLGKWIFLDAMKRAYFTDDNGNMLSVAEIRERLIRGQTLELNKDADYNGNPFDKDEYLNYLAKNLYRFSCSLDSKFGNYGIFHLTDVNRVYVHLDPAGEKQEGLGVAINYFTSNPDYFWSVPE
jgi:hypothetical protein